MYQGCSNQVEVNDSHKGGMTRCTPRLVSEVSGATLDSFWCLKWASHHQVDLVVIFTRKMMMKKVWIFRVPYSQTKPHSGFSPSRKDHDGFGPNEPGKPPVGLLYLAALPRLPTGTA